MLAIMGSIDSIKTYLLGFGSWTPVVFFAIQIAQVFIAPIPGGIITLIGGTLFGGLWGSLMSCIAILIGSWCAFMLARKLGRPFVLRFGDTKWIAKIEALDEGKLNAVLFLIFIIPGFPDDLLCFVAGLTKMPLRTYIALCIVGRFPGLIVTTLIGAGIMENDPVHLAILTGAYCLVSAILFLLRHKLEDFINQHRSTPAQADTAAGLSHTQSTTPKERKKAS